MLCNVLVVDDSSSARAVIRQIVRDAGVCNDRIFEAVNGQEALALFETTWIDLVLLNINMPVMNGECFARTLRAREDLADVKVLVVTADHDPLRHARLRQIGISGMITKPFRAEHLRTAVLAALPAAKAA